MSSDRAARRITAPLANLSLTTKGILVIAIPVCALLACMAIFYQFERRSRSAGDSVEHTYQVRGELRRAAVALGNAESAIQAYVMTRQQSRLEAYVAAREALRRPLDALATLVSDNPEKLQRLSRVRALVSQALASIQEVSASPLENPAERIAQIDRGTAEMADARRELQTMENMEGQLLRQRIARRRDAEARLQTAILAGGILGLLGGFFGIVLFTTRIVHRVHQLENNAHRVARGEPILEEVSGNDEIGRLEQALKETSVLLAKQGEELRAAHTDLESRVALRTTELSAAHEQLRQATELNNAVIQSSPLAIWAADLEGNVRFWNPAAERIFGWTEGEVIGRTLPIIPPEQQPEYREWLERFRKGEALAGIERQRLKKDGTRIDVMIWTAPLKDAGGNITGTIAIDSDLTQHKLLEQQFRQAQKLEAIGRLAGGVAHDFNNILTVIAGYTEMVIAETQGQPALLDYAREIQYAATRAGALTAQLLAFSRRQITQPRVLDLNDIVSHSMKLLRRVIGEDIEIEAHLDPNLGRVKADPIHIDQIIMNLVVNARDAMGEGGKLTIETRNQILDADYVGRHIGVSPGPYCLLAISDTGTGMTAETRARLFEPFFTTKEAGKGTGLGLSIVYGIVKQNGGEIMVYSEPGKGSTFKIYLPMAEVPAEFSAAETRATQMRGTETILLCEDEDAIRRLVHTMLAKQGYRVLDAATPDEAMKIGVNSAEPIHLLLTDLVMPRTSGFELAKNLREHRRDLKVLYMSGYTDNQVSRSWVVEPNMPFIQKPFTAAALTQKVREALTSSAAA
jgi:PAS domain S-box-containing protein